MADREIIKIIKASSEPIQLNSKIMLQQRAFLRVYMEHPELDAKALGRKCRLGEKKSADFLKLIKKGSLIGSPEPTEEVMKVLVAALLAHPDVRIQDLVDSINRTKVGANEHLYICRSTACRIRRKLRNGEVIRPRHRPRKGRDALTKIIKFNVPLYIIKGLEKEALREGIPFSDFFRDFVITNYFQHSEPREGDLEIKQTPKRKPKRH